MKDWKNKLNRVLGIASYIIIASIIVLGTIAAYYYANGYRINLDQGSIRKTGVLSVESKPSRADLFVNGEGVGRTPKTVAPVDEGVAEVELKKEGYVTWKKSVSIKAEKSSPLFPYLILSEPSKETIFTSDQKYINGYANTEGNYLFFTTKKDTQYTVWRYDVNRNFWDLTDNPKEVYETDENTENIELLPSPDGRLAVLTTETIDAETEKSVKNIELLHTVRNGVQIEDIDLEQFGSEYTISWSNDSKYILLESDDDIISLKVSDQTKYLLVRKSGDEPYIWNTDTEGFIYLAERQNEDEKMYYTLSQMLLDGTEKSTLIEKIYTQTSSKYIKEIREEPASYIPFTNAPENIRFSGELRSIAIDQETGGFFIETSYAVYWYDSDLEKYILINPYPSEWVSFSPDKTRLLLNDTKNEKMGVFTFEKEESDHVTQIGTRFIIENKDKVIKDSYWLSNSRNIVYTGNTSIRIVGVDGDNDTKIAENDGKPARMGNRDKHLYIVEPSEEEGLELNKLQIN